MLISDSLQIGSAVARTDTLRVILVSQESKDYLLVYVPLLIAFVAIFVGPLVQLLIGRRQIDAQLKIANDQLLANVRSSNRQQWIHILRGDLSEFTSQLGALFLNLDASGKPIDKRFHREKAERLIFLQTKILLLLNPTKTDHKQIIDMVDEARQAAVNRETARLELFANQITEKSQALFKLTWERIKKLE